MAENLLSLAEADPDRAAIIDEFTELTRAQFNARVNQLVHALRGAGLGPGDTVALLARTATSGWKRWPPPGAAPGSSSP